MKKYIIPFAVTFLIGSTIIADARPPVFTPGPTQNQTSAPEKIELKGAYFKGELLELGAMQSPRDPEYFVLQGQYYHSTSSGRYYKCCPP